MDQVEEYFVIKERALETVYSESKLQHSPDENLIKSLLLETLEEHYGSLDGCIETADHYKLLLKQIQKLVEKV
jgi:hypothetical protein